jgi:hypothetical protein
LYGDQTSALSKIFAYESDRTAIVAVDIQEMNNKIYNPLGILVYKNLPQNEYSLQNILEIKSLFLFNPETNSGKGIAKTFLNYLNTSTDTNIFSGLFVTVSEDKPESIKFFEKNGFKRINQIQDKYQKDKAELLYYFNFTK